MEDKQRFPYRAPTFSCDGCGCCWDCMFSQECEDYIIIYDEDDEKWYNEQCEGD